MTTTNHSRLPAELAAGDGHAIGRLVAHVTAAGASPAGRAAARRWAGREPALIGYGDPGQVASAAWDATVEAQDRIVAALVRQAPGDEWAALTAIAATAPRLVSIVAGWCRAGVAGAEVADAEADLVAESWAAVTAADGRPPPRPGLALVDMAHGRIRDARRRHRRRLARSVPLADATRSHRVTAASRSGRPGLEQLAVEVTDAVAGDRMPIGEARALYLTRVAGYTSIQAGRLLSCPAGSVRVQTGRAARRLAP